jgi:hypothetical protein
MIERGNLNSRSPQNLIGSKDPHALKIPARQGGIHSLTENAALQFRLNQDRLTFTETS